MARYDLLLADADETLLDFSKAEENALLGTAEVCGFSCGKREISVYSAANLACWKQFERGELTLPELRVRRFRDFFERCGIMGDPVRVSHVYTEALGQQGCALAGAAEALTRWEKRVRVLVVTNGISAVQRGRFARSPFPHLAREMVISEEIGIQKPNPGIVFEGMRRAGICDRSRVLFLGDSLSSDMQVAVNAGVDGCWYNPKGIRNTGVPVRYEVRDLDEVDDLL
ncbi:MAG: HAD-IA family hydrolase [Clostridiales bacterium]|nr:HAD-IA family hydrolase [Clostridiales bacterium]